MKLVLIVHRDDDALARFLEAARSARLASFTLLRSEGLSAAPDPHEAEWSIGSLAGLLTGARLENITALAFVQDERLPGLVELLKAQVADIGAPGNGYAVLPVEAFGGLE